MSGSKTIGLLALMACLCLPAMALAQPGTSPHPPPAGPHYAPPPPPPPPPSYYDPFTRRGLTLGFGFGIGNMSDSEGTIPCDDCDYDPAAGAFDFHIGGMLNPRLALLFEVWVTGKNIDESASEFLWQSMVLVAAQYWVTPRLWVKGGLGLAHLSLTYEDGYESGDEAVDDGGAALAAVGYEIVVLPRFALDLQLRAGVGSYDAIDEQVVAVSAGLGFNFY